MNTNKDTEERKATCQYCLADTEHSNMTMNKERRCPVCGSDYTGERRDKEYAALLEAGLVKEDE